MKTYTLIATTTFGLEAVVKRELIDLGFKIIRTENGKVYFETDKNGIVKSNLWLRSADRVLLFIAEFKAFDFDQLFDQIYQIKWHDYIAKNGKVIVNAKSIKSKLFSVPNIQRISNKSIIESLKLGYQTQVIKEDGPTYDVLISFIKDKATVTLDTSGAGLHKRGYRIETVDAPMKETLAAAIIMLSFWEPGRILYDTFCGSGTIPIEAALMARNIAPGLNRDFASKHWDFIGKEVWKEETKKAFLAINHDREVKIYASDISEKNLNAAIENAFEAGVDDCIEFTVSDFKEVDLKEDYGVIISNPPYGERLMEQDEAFQLYKDLGAKLRNTSTHSIYILTSFTDFEKAYGKQANKRRKLYNGRIETWYYQYYGPKPEGV
jgi:putative N6-adenine-specific DNA methylase